MLNDRLRGAFEEAVPKLTVVTRNSAAERGYIDDVIEPHQTRPKLISALRTLETKRVEQPKRKHGNLPL